jgi:putative MATE family efflux protein
MYALPSVVSQIISSVYNICDRIFIGHGVGALAIAGLAITMPVMNIIHAFGTLIGVGASARMSIVLGKKDINWAENILGNSFIFTIMLSGVVMLFSYIFLDKILLAFGATADTVAYAREYMQIVLPGMFLTTVAFNLAGIMRSSGYPTKSMIILASGAVLNIGLDALFIFVFKMGIAGAAWATTISMAFATVLAMAHFLKKSSFIRFRRHGFQPKGYIFKNITMIGLSPFLMNVAAAGVVAILNKQLIRYGGDLAVGAYGIANSYIMILVMLILGVCMGMQPIAGYNYGAGHPDRLKRVYVLTMKVCVLIGIFTAILGCSIPRIISMAFTNDSTLLDISEMALPYLTVMTPLIAFTIVNSNFFQSIDKPWIAIVTSLSRQVIFLIPMMYIMPKIYMDLGFPGLNGVFCSCTVSDVFGATLALILMLSQRKVFKYTA